MIDTNLIDILPEEMSDETIWHLVNFMDNLVLALEEHYFGQLQRYIKNNFDPSDYF